MSGALLFLDLEENDPFPISPSGDPPGGEVF
jgi:hypothetical protein